MMTSEDDVYGETLPVTGPPDPLVEVGARLAVLASEVADLTTTVDELTTALNKAIKVAIAHG